MKNQTSDSVRVGSCPSCGATNLSERKEIDKFAYGSGADQVELSIPVAVYSCADCSFEFTSGDVDADRHGEICRYLGVLSPSEIRSLREQYDLSRSRFAEISRLGEATIARWERGALIQNAAYDMYLRLLREPKNMARLMEVNDLSHSTSNTTRIDRFRVLRIDRTVKTHQEAFALRIA